MVELKDFSSLVDSYYAKVFYHCLKIVKNNHDSADITQNTFTKAFINIKNLKNIDAFGAWIFTICNNEIRLFYRNKQNVTNNLNIADKSNNSKKYDSLYSAIEVLDDKYKNLIILKYFAEFSVKEIALLTELDEKLIKSRLYDARKKLENILSKSKNTAGLLNIYNHERKKEIMSTVKLIELGSQIIPYMSAWGQKELLRCAENNEKFSNEILFEFSKIEKSEEFTLECGGKLSYEELIKILACCDDDILYRMSGLEYYTWRGGRERKLLRDVAAYLGTGAYIESLEFILNVPSIKNTKTWYKKHLGWGEDGTQADDDCGHSIIRVYNEENQTMSLTFKGIHLWKTCDVNEVTKNANCFVFVTGIEVLREKIKSTGWDKISDIYEPGWGVKQFKVEDLNGFNLHFSEWICD